MDAVELLTGAAPERAELIRRRFWRDPAFRGVCEDYRDARMALDRLETTLPADAMAIGQYRELTTELLAEALGMLEEGR